MFELGVERCRLCGTPDNLEYCGACGHWFCPTCKANKPERVKAFIQEKILRKKARQFN